MSLLSGEVDAVSDIGKIDLSPAYKVPSNIVFDTSSRYSGLHFL